MILFSPSAAGQDVIALFFLRICRAEAFEEKHETVFYIISHFGIIVNKNINFNLPAIRPFHPRVFLSD